MQINRNWVSVKYESVLLSYWKNGHSHWRCICILHCYNWWIQTKNISYKYSIYWLRLSMCYIFSCSSFGMSSCPYQQKTMVKSCQWIRFLFVNISTSLSQTGSGLALCRTRFSTSATDVGFVVYKMALWHLPVIDLDFHWQLSFCLCSVFIHNHCWLVR
jgi:hypothetical protein